MMHARIRLSLFLGIWGCLSMITGCAHNESASRGSQDALYTILETLVVHREDLHKSIQLKLDQKLLFQLELDPARPGTWEVETYDRRVLLLLSEHPKSPEGIWGTLLQARALGFGHLTLRFTPDDPQQEAETYPLSLVIRRA